MLAFLPSPLHAQTATVSFRVCNAGKTAVDIVVAQSAQGSTVHIAYADCATIAGSEGAMAERYVAIAFVDAHGQWGAAKRLDLMPEWASGVLDDFIDRNAHTAAVRHGASTVTLPTELLLHPPTPQCHTESDTTSAVSPLPLGATASQKFTATLQDHNRPATSGGVFCDQWEYTLNVEAYPSTREVAFDQFCDPCDKKADAARTPAERANAQRMAGAADAMIASLGNLGAEAQKLLDHEQRDREAELAPPVRVNFSDMVDYIYLALVREDSRIPPTPATPAPGSNGPVRRPNQQSSAPASNPPVQAVAPTPQTSPATATPQPARPAPAAQAPAAPPANQPGRAPLTAQERQAIAEKFTACLQQAVKDHPGGGPELSNASAACASIMTGK